jgi:hypothetical protein
MKNNCIFNLIVCKIIFIALLTFQSCVGNEMDDFNFDLVKDLREAKLQYDDYYKLIEENKHCSSDEKLKYRRIVDELYIQKAKSIILNERKAIRNSASPFKIKLVDLNALLDFYNKNIQLINNYTDFQNELNEIQIDLSFYKIELAWEEKRVYLTDELENFIKTKLRNSKSSYNNKFLLKKDDINVYDSTLISNNENEKIMEYKIQFSVPYRGTTRLWFFKEVESDYLFSGDCRWFVICRKDKLVEVVISEDNCYEHSPI